MKLIGKFKVQVGTLPNGRYIALINDLGFRKIYLTFYVTDIAEMLGITVEELFKKVDKMKDGESFEV